MEHLLNYTTYTLQFSQATGASVMQVVSKISQMSSSVELNGQWHQVLVYISRNAYLSKLFPKDDPRLTKTL